MDVLDFTLLTAAALVGGLFGVALGMMAAALLWKRN